METKRASRDMKWGDRLPEGTQQTAEPQHVYHPGTNTTEALEPKHREQHSLVHQHEEVRSNAIENHRLHTQKQPTTNSDWVTSMEHTLDVHFI